MVQVTSNKVFKSIPHYNYPLCLIEVESLCICALYVLGRHVVCRSRGYWQWGTRLFKIQERVSNIVYCWHVALANQSPRSVPNPAICITFACFVSVWYVYLWRRLGNVWLLYDPCLSRGEMIGQTMKKICMKRANVNNSMSSTRGNNNTY